MVISKKDFFAVQLPMLSVGGMACLLITIDMLLPFTSAYADVVPAYFTYLAFFIFVYFFYAVLVIMFESSRPRMISGVEPLNSFMTKCMSVACFLSVLGICSLVVDRTIYQGVDFFTQNFVEIRARLNADRAPGSGVSSFFSVFGNLFQFTYFFAFVCLVFYREAIGSMRRKLYWFTILTLLFSGSYILGGRSIIGLFALTFVGVMVARVVTGRSDFWRLIKFRYLIFMLASTGAVLAAIAFVFYVRASVSNLSSSEYLLNFVDHLRGRAVMEYVPCVSGVECDFINYAQLSGIYVVHIFWVFAELLESPVVNPQGSPVFGASAVILSKVLGQFVGDYEFAGLFNSLPGSLYYQYGALGMMVGGLFIGCALAYAVFSLRSSGGVFSLISFYAFFMVMLVAPVLSIMNMMVFVFLLFSMVAMGVVYLVGTSLTKRYLEANY